MSSNLQATLKSLKTSVYNIRFVATTLLSSSNTDHCSEKAENVHISAKQDYPLVNRLPNHINPGEMTRFSPQRSREMNVRAILKQQVGFPNCFNTTIASLQEDLHVRKSTRSDWASYNEKKGIMQRMHNNRKENMFSINNGALTKACVAFWHASHQSNVRLYSTGSSGQKENDRSNVSSSSGSDIENKEKPLSRKEMLKKAMKDYGSTVVVFYVGISLISLGSFYLLVSSGLDVVAVLQHFGWGDSALSNKLAAGASTFVVAYAVHMAFASVRISVTLAVTPFLVRYLRKKGFLKKSSGSK